MKKYIALLLFPLLHCAQESQPVVGLNDLKTPDSPGFQILDIAPSTVTRPDNPTEFAVTALQLSENGSIIPKNFAMEFSPFWFVNKNDGIYKYYNLHQDNNRNIFAGVLRKLSVSLTSAVLDSTKTGLPGETNMMAFGVRTNLITLRTKAQSDRFAEALENYNSAVGTLLTESEAYTKLNTELVQHLTEKRTIEKALELGTLSDSERKTKEKELKKAIQKVEDTENRIKDFHSANFEDFATAIDKDPDVKAFYKLTEEKPAFQLDAAFAYSEAYPDNSYANRRFNRSGVWFTGTLNFKGLDESTNDRFSLLFSGRLLQDNVLTDAVAGSFERKSAFDFGFKLEYALQKLTLGVEHISRSYSDAESIDSKRTVGILQYKISDDLYFTGTYGQNFGPDKPLFTLFGVNFGFGKEKLSTKTE